MNKCTEKKYRCAYENNGSKKKRELKTEKVRKKQGNLALEKKATFLGVKKKKERKRQSIRGRDI